MAVKLVYTQPGKIRLYSTEELVAMPPPTWLIDSVLPAEGFIGLYGAPGSAKSFVAIDMACCVASGRAWHGMEVDPGLVLYVSAEGGSGIGKRVLGWCRHNGVSPKAVEMAWAIEPICISPESADLGALFARVEEVREHPTMVVIDTLARCFDGDENKQEDMGAFVNGIDRLRHELNTTVLIVHHSRLDGERERGNTAFRGAADAMIQVKRSKNEKGDRVILVNDKQKDGEEFPVLKFNLVVRSEEDTCVIA